MQFINGHYHNFEIKPLNGLIPTFLECATVILAFFITATSSVGQILNIFFSMLLTFLSISLVVRVP